MRLGGSLTPISRDENSRASATAAVARIGMEPGMHGFGFATALSAFTLGSSVFLVALLGFNLCIEAAQIGIFLFIMPALAMLGGGVWMVRTGSAAAAAVALAWLWQRLPSVMGLADRLVPIVTALC